MSTMTRRTFVNMSGATLAAVAGAGVTATEATGAVLATGWVEGGRTSPETQSAILYDSTLCIGCRSCELACNEANQLDRTVEEIFSGCEFQDGRALGPDVLSCVTQHVDEADSSNVTFGKIQCMHCLDPACVSVCPVGAMEKTPEGPVVWHGDLCLGCRYCMMACPFEVPRFEWDSANPRIRKCEMCADRIRDQKKPACVETCPSGALSFGPRADRLAEAERRISEEPWGYFHGVYGKGEAGGGNVLHIAARPFDQLGYKADLPETSPASAARPAMAAIPFVLNGMALLLGASAWFARRRGGLTPLSEEGEET